MDLLLHAQEQNIAIPGISEYKHIKSVDVQEAFTDFTSKDYAGEYLRLPKNQNEDHNQSIEKIDQGVGG